MDTLLYQFLFLFIATTADSKPDCQYGWTPFGKHCYYYSTRPETYKDAVIQCINRRGQLMELENRREEIWLRLHSLLRGNTLGVWIGYSDIIQTKQFLTLSDAKLPRYTHWNPGEPNNLHGVEHCAIYLTQHDAWNDGNCNDKWLYVCKQ